MSEVPVEGLRLRQALAKRSFDLLVAIAGLACLWWLILMAFLAASADTRGNGFFLQRRVGRHGRIFQVVKIKTMYPSRAAGSTVTTASDPRITPLGRFFRKTKIDELPQLWNVLTGDMSLVGPRPDVPGYADCLEGETKLVLSVRPGITGPATLKYRDEEALLARQADPEDYNRRVIFPDKVQINVSYVRTWRFINDLKYIWRTIVRERNSAC